MFLVEGGKIEWNKDKWLTFPYSPQNSIDMPIVTSNCGHKICSCYMINYIETILAAISMTIPTFLWSWDDSLWAMIMFTTRFFLHIPPRAVSNVSAAKNGESPNIGIPGNSVSNCHIFTILTFNYNFCCGLRMLFTNSQLFNKGINSPLNGSATKKLLLLYDQSVTLRQLLLPLPC